MATGLWRGLQPPPLIRHAYVTRHASRSQAIFDHCPSAMARERTGPFSVLSVALRDEFALALSFRFPLPSRYILYVLFERLFPRITDLRIISINGNVVEPMTIQRILRHGAV